MDRRVRDRPRSFRGGADRWDEGPAGALVTAEWFGASEPPPPLEGGGVLVRTASGWVARPVKVWLAAAWVEKPARRWTGSAWVLT